MPDSQLYTLARKTLDAVTSRWPDAAAGPSPLPPRRYVACGAVAWDCEQLTVSADRSFGIEADVSAEGIQTLRGFTSNRAVAVTVSIIRCVPTVLDIEDGTAVFPEPQAIEDSAKLLLWDEQATRKAVADAQKAGELAGCGSFAFEGWTALGPEGGFGGGAVHLRLSLA